MIDILQPDRKKRMSSNKDIKKDKDITLHVLKKDMFELASRQKEIKESHTKERNYIHTRVNDSIDLLMKTSDDLYKKISYAFFFCGFASALSLATLILK